MTENPPKVLYLQWYGITFNDWEGATWCIDQINDDDVEYVLAKPYKDSLSELLKIIRDHGNSHMKSHATAILKAAELVNNET